VEVILITEVIVTSVVVVVVVVVVIVAVVAIITEHNNHKVAELQCRFLSVAVACVSCLKPIINRKGYAVLYAHGTAFW